MKNFKISIVFILIISIFLLSFCGKEEISDSSSEEPSSITEEPQTEIQTEEPENEITSETEPEPQQTETTAQEQEEIKEMEDFRPCFMGYPMDESIYEINRKTASISRSMIFDVTSKEFPSKDEILQMVYSYEIGSLPVSDEILFLRDSVVNHMDEMKYGLVTENVSVRSFPAPEKHKNPEDLSDFDYFQENMFNIGEGVLILAETEGQEWYFVKGSNYYGFVDASKVAVVSEEEFDQYLNTKSFVVSTVPSQTLNGKNIRMGTILPFDSDTQMVTVPVKLSDGDTVSENDNTFVFKKVQIDMGSGSFSEGFMPYSPESQLNLMSKMLETPYGWGDTDEDYDCSSTIGSVMRCFGIYSPRNTSIMSLLGQTEEETDEESAVDSFNVEGWNLEDKLALLEGAPGAIIIIPGHAMMYSGLSESGHMVYHNTTGFYASDGTRISAYKTISSSLEEMYNKDLVPFTELIKSIIIVDCPGDGGVYN